MKRVSAARLRALLVASVAAIWGWPLAALASPPVATGEIADATVAPTPAKYSLHDGPLICLRKLKEKLGPNAQVSKIVIRFFTEEGLSDSTRTDGPPGGLDVCSATYQNPADPRKLFAIEMDSETGAFSEPEPVRLTVIGDAESFRLEEILVPLAKINIDAMEKEILAREAELSKKYSQSQFTTLLLSREAGHGPLILALVSGLLKSNDIAMDSQFNLTLDGKSY